MTLTTLYKPSLALLTDLYQLTMGAGYFHAGMADHETVFHLFFRKPPFRGAYTVFAGLAQVVDYLAAFRFDAEDLAYLADLRGNDGKCLFQPDYLAYLADMRFSCDVDAPPEGTLVFPHQPLLRVQGPIIQCQLLETVLLNMINFPSLVATKASRVVDAAGDDPVLEFGLRRAQGFDGALTATRAAYVGGCSATSNVLAGRLMDLPVRGTHAHSWVMAFDGEEEAFEAYAAAMPNNCIFLVDTYHTPVGVQRAVKVAARLKARGHAMVGIRLDSGDLTALSIQARRILDEAGFPDARIVASNDLDEYEVRRLKQAGARIDMWGVGTRLVTAYDQPALGGVYKLGAVRAPGEAWQYRLKLSETPEKVSNPGILQVARLSRAGRFVGDVLYDEALGFEGGHMAAHAGGPAAALPAYDAVQPLLQPLFRGGEAVGVRESAGAARARVAAQKTSFAPEHLDFLSDQAYPHGLDPRLAALKHHLTEGRRAS